MAQAAGAARVHVTGINRDEQVRLPRTQELGIDHAQNVMQVDLAALGSDLTGHEGADVVIELSGALPAIAQIFHLARRLGRVGIIGQPPTDEVSILYRDALFRAPVVSFSYNSRYTGWERVLSLFECGALESA